MWCGEGAFQHDTGFISREAVMKSFSDFLHLCFFFFFFFSDTERDEGENKQTKSLLFDLGSLHPLKSVFCFHLSGESSTSSSLSEKLPLGESAPLLLKYRFSLNPCK